MQYPNIADEFGYLGRARYLAGFSHFTHDVGIYHFGYALFLLPSFWLFSDPYCIYKAVLITNSFLISYLYFPIFYILRTLLNNNKRLSSAISIVCCLYPAFVLQSNLAWVESAFIPLYALFIASFGAFIRHKFYRTLLLFSFLTGFLYTVHPRALPILPIVIGYMFVLYCLGQATKTHLFICLLTLTVIFIATTGINNHFVNISNTGIQNGLLTNQLNLVFTPSKFAPLSLFVRVSARLQYLILSTYGLFLVGLLFVCSIIKKRWAQRRSTIFSDVEFNIALILALSSLAIFTASSLISGSRADHLFYGRYNEGFLSLYLMFGLLFIYSKPSSYPVHIINPFIISSAIIILMLIIVHGHGPKTLAQITHVTNVNVINIIGIYPLIGVFRRLDIIRISLIYVPLIFLLMYTIQFRFKLGLVLLMSYFCLVSITAYTVFYGRASYIQQITTLASNIRTFGDVQTVSYDKAFQNSDTWPAYQYLLPGVVFKVFNSSKNERPSSRLVISGKKWKDRRELRSKLIACENAHVEVPPIIRQVIQIFFEKPLPHKHYIDQCLWLLPEKSSPPLTAPMK